MNEKDIDANQAVKEKLIALIKRVAPNDCEKIVNMCNWDKIYADIQTGVNNGYSVEQQFSILENVLSAQPIFINHIFR